MRPSVIAGALSGTLAFIGLVVLVYLLASRKMAWDSPPFVMGILLLSIAFGVHGLSHFGEELHYGFNPLTGNWQIPDNPIR